MIEELKETYKVDSNFKSFFKEIWFYANFLERTGLVIGFVLFIVFSIFYFIEGKEGNFYIEILAIIEIILMVIFIRLKNKAFKKEACFILDHDQRSSRYMLFRKKVFEKKLSVPEINKILPVLDAEISLIETGRIYTKKVSTFGLPLFIGLFVAIMKKLPEIEFIIIATIFGFIVFILVLFLSMGFRSQEEKAKELKLFTVKYISEHS